MVAAILNFLTIFDKYLTILIKPATPTADWCQCKILELPVFPKYASMVMGL